MKIVKPSTIAGVMELLPEDQLAFDKMKNIIEETYKKFQFLPIDTPVIEKNEILFAKGGGETEKQIYEIASETKMCIRDRYESLRKLGIGEEKIKKTIDKQVLVFFFLPLVVSGIHVGFAFKMISKIFVMLGLSLIHI